MTPLTVGMWQAMQPVAGLTGQIVACGAAVRSNRRNRSLGFAASSVWPRMAHQAFGLVTRRCGRHIAVRVVTGRAIEPVLAFGVAAAPGQRRPLEADRVGVVRHDGLAPRAVTLGADLHHAGAGDQGGAGDRQVRKPKSSRTWSRGSGSLWYSRMPMKLGSFGRRSLRERSVHGKHLARNRDISLATTLARMPHGA